MPTEIGVGLIGYGAIGRVHALCYRMLPLCYPALDLQPKLVAVAVGSAQGAAKAQRELGDIAVTTTIDDLIARPDVGLIDCCGPTGAHAAMVQAALVAGKPVFCEKPLAVAAGESAALAALAAERGLACGVNYHFRCVPALQAAKRWIDAGNLGDVVGFQMRYYRASNLKRDRAVSWRFQGPGSGVMLDLGAHLIDLTLYLLGPIVSVAAHTRTLVAARPGPDGALVQVDSDDAAWLAFALAGGGHGTAQVSKIAPGAADDLRIEAYGTHGTLMFDTADPNRLTLADSAGQRQDALFSAATPAPAYPGSELVTAPVLWHLTSLAAYLTALGGSGAPVPSFADGARVDAVLLAAQRSAAHGGAVEACTV